MDDEREFELRRDHGWIATPGWRIFVIDRGAVRFEFPSAWVVRPDDDSVKLHDAEPPADECTIAVSYHRIPAIAVDAFPVPAVLRTAAADDKRNTVWGSIVEATRSDLSIAWQEGTFRDVRTGAEAKTRLCLARRGTLQALLTMEFWEADRGRVAPVWDHILRSIDLDEPIADPLRGPCTH